MDARRVQKQLMNRLGIASKLVDLGEDAAYGVVITSIVESPTLFYDLPKLAAANGGEVSYYYLDDRNDLDLVIYPIDE